MSRTYYAIRVRGEDRYYAGNFEFTPDVRRACVVEEAEARRMEHCLPIPVDAVEVTPWWVSQWAELPTSSNSNCRT